MASAFEKYLDSQKNSAVASAPSGGGKATGGGAGKTTVTGTAVSDTAKKNSGAEASLFTQYLDGKKTAAVPQVPDEVRGKIYLETAGNATARGKVTLSGNIDVTAVPQVGVTKKYTVAIDDDGQSVLIPAYRTGTSLPTQLTDKEAYDQYKKTGEYFGKFSLDAGQRYLAAERGVTAPNGGTKTVKQAAAENGDSIADYINEIEAAAKAQSGSAKLGTGDEADNRALKLMQQTRREAAKQDIADTYQQSGTAGRIALAAASVPLNVVAAPALALTEAADNLRKGRFASYERALPSANEVVQIIREQGATNIAAQFDGEMAGKVASVVYQSLLSAADSALGVALAPVAGANTYLIGMGANAADMRARELYDQGATAQEILAGAAISGAAEYITEKVSFGNLVDAWDAKTIKATIGKAVGQIAAEGLEEGAADVMNLVGDVLVREGRSDFMQSVRAYTKQGLNYHDANRRAICDVAEDAAWSMVGGAIAGAAGGAGALAGQGVRSLAENRAITKLGTVALTDDGARAAAIEEGLKNARVTDAYKTATRMQNGEKVTAHEVGLMLVQSRSEANATALIRQQVVESSAAEYGVDAELAAQIGDIAAKTKMNIEFAAPSKIGAKVDYNGLWDTETDALILNPNRAAAAMPFILKHEMTHATELTEQYTKLVALAEKDMGVEAFDAKVAKMINARAGTNAAVDERQAEREVIADWVGDNLYKGDFYAGMMQEAPEAVGGVARVFGAIKDAFGGRSPVERAERVFARALENARKGAEADRWKPLADRLTRDDPAREYSVDDLKARQFEIVQENNPKDASLNKDATWIDSIDDIKTFEEAVRDDGTIETGVTPDFTAADVQEAIRTGRVTVYSSKEIVLGSFVTPSRMLAVSYGNRSPYSKAVALTDVAWIDGSEGQYAPVEFSVGEVPGGAVRESAEGTAGENGQNARRLEEFDAEPYTPRSFRENATASQEEDIPQSASEYKARQYVPQSASEYEQIQRAREQSTTEQNEPTPAPERGEKPGTVIRRSANADDVAKVARQIIRANAGTVKADKIAGEIKRLADTVVNGVTNAEGWDAVVRRSREIAKEIVESAEVVTNADALELKRDVTDYLKGKTVRADVADSVKEEARENGLKVRYAENGTPIGALYAEMQELFGRDAFPAEIESEEDIVARISEVLGVERQTENPYAGEIEEQIDNVAADIRAAVMDASEAGRREQSVRAAERAQNRSERMTKTKLRNKINTIRDKLYKELENPTRKNNIPTEMGERVADLLDAVFDTPEAIEADIRKLEDAKAEAATRTDRERIQKKIDRRRHQLGYIGHELETIKKMYAKNAERYADGEGNVLVKHVGFERNIDRVINMMDGKGTLWDLSVGELNEVADLMQAIAGQIIDAGKLHSTTRSAELEELATDSIEEMQRSGGLGKLAAARKLLLWQMRPDVFFNEIMGWTANGKGEELAEMLESGQRKELEIKRAFSEAFYELVNSKDYDRLFSTKDKDLVEVGLVGTDGKPIKLTRGMMLSLMMHLERDGNKRAIMTGGITVPDIKLYYKGKTSDAVANGREISVVSVSEEIYNTLHDIDNAETDEEKIAAQDKLTQLTAIANQDLDRVRDNIRGQMTEWEKRFVDTAKTWFNETQKDYINEATDKVWHYLAARVDDYFPIYRNKNFVNTAFESVVSDMMPASWGNVKNRTVSKSPVVVADISTVLNTSANGAARFAAWLPFTTDMNALWNYRVNVGNNEQESFKNTLGRMWGAESEKVGVSGVQYIENLMADITGSRKSDSSFLGFFRRNTVRATLSINMRVAISQAASFPTAAAEVGWQHVNKALLKLPKVSGKNGQQLFAEVGKYSPYFYERWRGAGGMEEIHTAGEGTGLTDRAYRWIDKKTRGKLVNWCQEVDVRTVAGLWFACEEKVAAETELTRGTVAFKEAVGAELDRVIRKTQPNFTTAERSDLMRSKSEMLKFLTMYKTQSNQNFNIAYEAIARHRAYKSGKAGATAEDLRAAKTAVVNSTTALMVATLVFVAMRNIINAALHRVNGLRDKETKELTAGSIAAGLGKEMASSVAGAFVFGDAVWETVAAIVFGDKFYGASDNALEVVGDIMSDITSGGLTDPSKWRYTLQDIGSGILGAPIKNVWDIVDGIALHVQDINNGAFLSFDAGADITPSVMYVRLYRAVKDGDDEKADSIREKLIAAGKTESEIETGLRSVIRKKDGTAEERAQEMLKEAYSRAAWAALTKTEQTKVKNKLTSYAADLLYAESYGGKLTDEHEKARQNEKKGFDAVNYYLAKAIKTSAYADKDGDGDVSKREYRKAIDETFATELVRRMAKRL